MKYCDLIMKGGVTSGVVYPLAVFELSSEYWFKNIGGTSAGAIAAGVTAAAECARRRTGKTAGYDRLKQLPNDLAQDGFGHVAGVVGHRHQSLGRGGTRTNCRCPLLDFT